MDERLKRAGEVSLVPFSKIIVDDEINSGRIDFGDINELANSIEENGLKIPLLVKKTRGEDTYVLIQGKRRLKAIELLAKKGIEFNGIKCFLAPLNYGVEDSLFDQIIMNDGKPYSQLEQGIVFSSLLKRGYKQSEIAKKTGKSNVHIGTCIEIASLPKRVRDMVADGSVSGLTAVNLSKVVKNEDELISKLENAVESSPVDSEGKKKKVTNKNVKEVSLTSTIKKMEEVKRIISEKEGLNKKIVEFYTKFLSRLKAGENPEEFIDLFE